MSNTHGKPIRVKKATVDYIERHMKPRESYDATLSRLLGITAERKSRVEDRQEGRKAS